MSDPAPLLVTRLLRGISTDHVETVRDAWRDLHADPMAAVPAVVAKLASRSWAQTPRGPSAKYLGVLLMLLHELDPTRFSKEIERLSSSDLHPWHRKTIELLGRRADQRPIAHVGPGIPLYVSPAIVGRELVVENLAGWTATTDLAVDDVSRIDVIERSAELSYLGHYNMLFSSIVLTWPKRTPWGLGLFWSRLDAEFTFYHEVGHHAHRHVEGGTLADQEREADAYARAALARSRPGPSRAARFLLAPLRPLLRRLTDPRTHPALRTARN